MSTQRTIATAKSASGSQSPFAKLRQMLRDGKIGPGSNRRRYIPGFRDSTDLTWEEMADLGSRGDASGRGKRKKA